MSKSRWPSDSADFRPESQREGATDVGEAFGAHLRTVYEDGRGEEMRDEMRRSTREGRFPAR